VEPGTRLEVYWPHQKAWFPATIEQERTHKRENYLVCYDGKTEREWIDLHRHKIRNIAAAKLHPKEVVVVQLPRGRKLQRKSSSFSFSNGSVAKAERRASTGSVESATKKPPAAATAQPDGEQPTATIQPPMRNSLCHHGEDGDNYDNNRDVDGDDYDEKPGVCADTAAAQLVQVSSSSDDISPASFNSNRSVVQGFDQATAPSPALHPAPEEKAARIVSTSSEAAAVRAKKSDDASASASREDLDTKFDYHQTTTEGGKPNRSPESQRLDRGESEAAGKGGVERRDLRDDSHHRPESAARQNSDNDSGEEEGIILDPVNDPATMSAVYSLIDVGSRVSIYWEDDDEFFNATVTDRKLRGKPFYVEYDDGDEEWIDLRKHKFRLIPSHAPSESGDRFVGGKRLRRVSGKDASTKSGETKSGAKSGQSPKRSVGRPKPTDQSPVKPTSDQIRSAQTASPDALAKKDRKVATESDDDDNDDDSDSGYLSFPDELDNDTAIGTFSPPAQRTTSATEAEKAPVNSDLSKITVGSRVAVWWDGDKQFYNGTVKRQRAHKKPFFLEYDDDGKEEWIDFAEHDFRLLPNMPTERKRRGRPSNREDPSRVRVGSRVAVWWASASKFYEGTVTKKRKHDHPYFIKYDHGEAAGHWIDFSKHTFRLLDIDFSAPKRSNNPSGVSKLKQEKRLKTGSTDADAHADKKKMTKTKADGNAGKTKRKKPSEPRRESSDALAGLEITVGTRVAVYWEGDSKYYEGKVTKERKTGKKRHYLEYDDGEAAHWIDFKEHWVRVLPDRTPKKRKKSNGPPVAAAAAARSSPKRKERENSAKEPPKGAQKDRAAAQAKVLAKIKVGSRVEIWWAGDDCYYKGTVTLEGKQKNRFFVEYDDGEEEWVNFSRQAFHLLPTNGSTSGAAAKEKSWSSSEEELVDEDDVDSSDEDVDETNLYNDFVYGAVDDVHVGSKLSVWWPAEKKYYEGKVAKIDNSRKPYFIKYKDGDEEWTDLRRRYFRLL